MALVEAKALEKQPKVVEPQPKRTKGKSKKAAIQAS